MDQKILVDQKTYEMLKSLKRPDESFSKLLLRLIRSQRAKILDHYGRWSMTDKEVDNLMNRLEVGWCS
ncbi:MAG: antitoxin VapB family protein [Candidatus Thorarchaeota archaeon]